MIMRCTPPKSRTLLLLCLPIFFTACVFSPSTTGNGHVIEEERTVEPFHQISASRGINLYITQGETTSLRIVADDNLIDIIETEVIGGELIVRSTENVRKTKSYNVFVSTPEIDFLSGSAGCNIYSETELVADNFNISASSGTNLRITLQAENLEASASSGSNITLDGIARDFIARASSGSNLRAEDLKTKNAELKVSSGSNIWTSVSHTLNAHASSGGNIFYSGSPTETNFSKSSGGNIKLQ